MISPSVDLQGYLAAAGYRERYPRAREDRAPIRPFVTISRQTGAGGHTLGEALLRRMAQEPDDPRWRGWQVVDRALCDMLLQDPALHVSMRSLLREEYRSQIEDLVASMFGGRTPQDAVLRKVCETVRGFAVLGHAVILGRGGACVTKGLPGGVHVRLVAPEAIRVRRMMQILGAGEAAAREAVKTQDRDRAALVRSQFHRDIEDPLLYDAVWNTEAAPFDLIAGSIMALITHRTEAQPAVHERPIAYAQAGRGGVRAW
jgi:hypothetical protein